LFLSVKNKGHKKITAGQKEKLSLFIQRDCRDQAIPKNTPAFYKDLFAGSVNSQVAIVFLFNFQSSIVTICVTIFACW